MDSVTPETPARILTRAERIGLLAEWIVAGLRASQVAAEWRRAGWGDLSPAEAIEVTAEAHRLIQLDAAAGVAVERAKAIARYQDLIARANEIQDYKVALRAQSDLLKTVAAMDAAARLVED